MVEYFWWEVMVRLCDFHPDDEASAFQRRRTPGIPSASIPIRQLHQPAVCLSACCAPRTVQRAASFLSAYPDP